MNDPLVVCLIWNGPEVVMIVCSSGLSVKAWPSMRNGYLIKMASTSSLALILLLLLRRRRRRRLQEKVWYIQCILIHLTRLFQI